MDLSSIAGGLIVFASVFGAPSAASFFAALCPQII